MSRFLESVGFALYSVFRLALPWQPNTTTERLASERAFRVTWQGKPALTYRQQTAQKFSITEIAFI